MKPILVVIALFLGVRAFGQSYQQSIDALSDAHQKCLDDIAQRRTKAADNLEGQWYAYSTNPNAVMLACDNHCPRYFCIRHHRQCESQCDCATQYRKLQSDLGARYDALKDACDKDYQDKYARLQKEEEAREAAKERADSIAAAAAAAQAQASSGSGGSGSGSGSSGSGGSGGSGSGGSGSSGSGGSGSGSGSGDSSKSYSPPPRDARIDRNWDASRAQDSAMTQVMDKAKAVMAAGMIAGIEDESDDDSHPFYLKLNLGIGYENVPMNGNTTLNSTNNYGNSVTTNYGTSTSTNNMMVKVSFLMSFFNNKFINFKLSPFGSWGNNAYSTAIFGLTGPTGDHVTYGSGASLGIGKRFRLTLNGEYAYRGGDYSQDSYPVVDAITTGSYGYSTIKYGPGIWWSLKNHDSFLEAIFYKENVSFLSGINANVYSARFKVSFQILSFDFEYGKNYPLAGVNDFPKNYQVSEQGYFMFTISVPFTLAKK